MLRKSKSNRSYFKGHKSSAAIQSPRDLGYIAQNWPLWKQTWPLKECRLIKNKKGQILIKKVPLSLRLTLGPRNCMPYASQRQQRRLPSGHCPWNAQGALYQGEHALVPLPEANRHGTAFKKHKKLLLSKNSKSPTGAVRFLVFFFWVPDLHFDLGFVYPLPPDLKIYVICNCLESEKLRGRLHRF